MVNLLVLSLTLAVGQVDPGTAQPASSNAPMPVIHPASGGIEGMQSPAPGAIVHDAQEPGDKSTTQDKTKTNGKAEKKDEEKKDEACKDKDDKKDKELHGCFLQRLCQAYWNAITEKDDRWEKKKDDKDKQDCNGDKKDESGDPKNGGNGDSKNGSNADSKNGGNGDSKEADAKPERRALPEPWSSPPFPGHEYQGYPLIGVPREEEGSYPIMKALYAGPWGQDIKDSHIIFAGWATSAGTWSTARNSNTPTAYWIEPNRYELDQLVFRLERLPDTVQQDHIDWGFRAIALYGMDYRYTTAGGWFSDQLLLNNNLYGWDPTELYFNVYIPGFLGGTDIRVGRWIACPDIETQYSVDNYMGSHSILFTYDTYTQTGIMVSQNIDKQWMFQAVLMAGTDMAPWYPGATPTGAFGVRYVTEDNNDAMYTWLNAINNAEFRHFEVNGQPAGHDNFNYVVTTWEHRFSEDVHTKTEAYFMWQRNAELGGTPSLGPLESYGGGGGDGMTLPGMSLAYGVLNYTMFALNKQDYITLRNEWWRDERGMRSGFPGNYTSNTIGLSHNINSVLQIRPEIGYYRNWDNPAFDLGTKHDLWLYGFDVTLRF
jgi:Putative beta-barrel porin-2, OmpL-like. bbp2